MFQKLIKSMAAKQHLNFLTHDNGVKVIECSSAGKGSSAEHVLQNTRKSLWLSEQGFPQYLTFDLTEMKKRPKLFKCFGVDCWHDYQSNPKRIEIQVSPNLQNFISWCTIKLEMVSGTQFFDIDPIPVCYGYIKIIILESFGDQKCYVNQVFLLAENPQTNDEIIPEPFAVPAERIRSTSASQEIPSRGSRGIRTPPGRNSGAGDHQKIIKNFEGLPNSGSKSVDCEFQEYVFKEIRDLKMQLEEQRGRNRNLEAKVEHLEDVVDQKQKMIHNLTDLIGTVTDELRRVKEELGYERNQTRQQIGRELNTKFEELERNIARKTSALKAEPMREPHRDFIAPRINSHNYSGSKAKNSESSLRHKQQGLADLIGQLKEAIELREYKLSQLKTITGHEFEGYPPEDEV